MAHALAAHPGHKAVWAVMAGILMTAAIVAIFLLAPAEQSMGAVQRILYVHVSVAWLALIGLVATSATGCVYLLRRDLIWDQWSQAAAELGWLCGTLTLVTGSLWASEAWNTWWTWDPRLTTAFVLWLIYCGYLLVRGNVEDPHARARVSAVVAIVGLLDVPLVVMATRWFRGIHPVAPEMDPMMRGVLFISAFSFASFFGLLLVVRRKQIHQESVIAAMEQAAVGLR